MITNDRTASELAIELFETGRYDQLGEIVQPRAAEADERAAYPVTSWIRDVVGWLCEARTHDDDEASRHREALARIASRHEEQKQTLGAIFDLIDDARSGPDNAADGQTPEGTRGNGSPSLAVSTASASSMSGSLGGPLRTGTAARAGRDWSSSRRLRSTGPRRKC